jgi:hypothetical protein
MLTHAPALLTLRLKLLLKLLEKDLKRLEPRVHVPHDISVLEGLAVVQLRRQYLYFCTSKASKMRMYREVAGVSTCTFVLVKQVN